MRSELLEKLSEIARKDERTAFITADLGFGVVEKFASEFPDRFFNVGVAEQGMIAAATGMAEAGMIPYCYSIGTFVSLRAMEFIRNGPVAHKLPVKIIGVGAGMDYGFDGLTHFAIDDISALRSNPGLGIWAPADSREVTLDLEEIHNDPRPTYIRLLRSGNLCSENRLHQATSLGDNVAILSLGDAHSLGSRVKELLHERGIRCSHNVVTRLDESTIGDIARHLSRTSICITVENHFITGGLGSLVCEAVATRGFAVRVFRMGVERLPIGIYGDSRFLESEFMTSPNEVVAQVALSHEAN